MAIKYGSDLIVDLLHDYGIEYAALNPGSSYRGLHDSIVNYGKNSPQLIECTHEEVAVQIAHGYAKATGKPMAAILHNTVGLLHGAMAIYYAYIDRAPVLVLGATGPMEIDRRRPFIDWIHTAVHQGDAVRNYVKWDYQPAGAPDTVESFARGYRIATSEPKGPVYLCYDAGFQEDEYEEEELNNLLEPQLAAGSARPTRLHADPVALGRIADLLVGAESPVIATSLVGREPSAVGALVELAELIGAAVIDNGERMSFPHTHALNALGREEEVLGAADVLLILDVRHLDKLTTKLNRTTRVAQSLVKEGCRTVEIGLGDLAIGSWSQEFGPVHSVELSVLADTAVALPALVEQVRVRIAGHAGYGDAAAARRGRHGAGAAERRAAWREEALSRLDERPIATPSFVHEIGAALEGTDWVLTANTVHDWARRLWPIDRPDQHPGKSLGTATQIGISAGVALAYKDTGRLVVDIQPDGDLLFDPGALWTLAYHHIPMLVVMFNNRAYYNDWEHQVLMARARGRDEAMAYLGMEIDKPAPDFAAIARGFGWHADGPVESAREIRAAVRRARDVVLSERRPALVDIITQYK